MLVYAAGWRLAALLIAEERAGIVEIFRYLSDSVLHRGKLFHYPYYDRAMTSVIITAHNVTHALDNAPQSYAYGEKVFSMVKDAENVSYSGNMKTVSLYYTCKCDALTRNSRDRYI